MDHTPKAYQQGWIEFYKLRFKVTPDVLIPRPETEILVDEVITFINTASSPNPELRTPNIILDIGTGSGCIAISLAKNLSNIKIIATDISGKALEIAKLNAKLHQVNDRISFIQSNLLDSLNSEPRRFQRTSPLAETPNPEPLIIVANLPYIPSSRIPKLDYSVKDFEPHLALDGGKDGFNLYRKLFSQICTFSLTPGRCTSQTPYIQAIFCEIDDTQEELALEEAKNHFPKAKVEVKKDLFKRPRLLLISFFKIIKKRDKFFNKSSLEFSKMC